MAGVVLLLAALVTAVRAEEQPLDPVLGAQPIEYPDLQPDVGTVFVDTLNGPPAVFFDTLSINRGSVSLQVTADDPEQVLTPEVSQCISWYTDRLCREQQRVGGFTWHEEHTHFHYEDFATYSLRRLLADGTPDYSAAGVVSISEKVSFCFIDSTQVEPESSLVPFYTVGACEAPFLMGISAGWADIYTWDLDGQSLPLEDASDGRYALVIDQNYDHSLLETDYTNNRIVAILEISGLGGFAPTVSVVDRSWPTTDGGGTTTTTTSSSTTTSTSTTTTSTTAPCSSTTSTTRRNGGGNGGGGGGGNGNGGGGGGNGKKKC